MPVIAGMDRAILQQYLDPSKGHALGDEWGFHGTKFPRLTRKAQVCGAGEKATHGSRTRTRRRCVFS